MCCTSTFWKDKCSFGKINAPKLSFYWLDFAVQMRCKPVFLMGDLPIPAELDLLSIPHRAGVDRTH